MLEKLSGNRDRLHLAKNGLSDIPYEFSQCSPLKYLNLRDNKFREIPKAVCRERENVGYVDLI